MHLKRWITGLSALPVLIFLVYSGGIPFLLLIGIAGICAQWEYNRIISNADPDFMSSVVVWCGYLTNLLILAAAHLSGISLVAVLLALNLVIVGVMSVFLYPSNPRVGLIIQKQVLGIIYIPVSLSLLAVIRNGPDGMMFIFLLLGIIFAGDTSAYYVGTYLGRHKLSPAISHGKTFEASLGGLIGNLLVVSIGVAFFLPSISWGAGILFFLAVFFNSTRDIGDATGTGYEDSHLNRLYSAIGSRQASLPRAKTFSLLRITHFNGMEIFFFIAGPAEPIIQHC